MSNPYKGYAERTYFEWYKEFPIEKWEDVTDGWVQRLALEIDEEILTTLWEKNCEDNPT